MAGIFVTAVTKTVADCQLSAGWCPDGPKEEHQDGHLTIMVLEPLYEKVLDIELIGLTILLFLAISSTRSRHALLHLHLVLLVLLLVL